MGIIRKCGAADFGAMLDVVNDAAQAYCGVIDADCWKDPYMSPEELRHEVEDGVEFWAYEEEGRVTGIMGLQEKPEVTLIRHAYVRTEMRSRGIGSKLLCHLERKAGKPVLIGTWKAAVWAVSFYQKHGYRLVTPGEKDRLLRKYWDIPDRQIETSVVMADQKWFRLSGKE